MNLVIFPAEVKRYYASCVCNSYSFAPIPLELYTCLGYGLKMCILFRYHPKIIFFCHFFSQMNLVIFPIEVNRYYASCVCNFSYSFALIPLKLYRCSGHGLKMCILFGYNPQIILLFLQIEFSRFLGVYYYQDMNVLRIKFSD